MALTEQRIVNQISVLPNKNAISVQWADQIVKDGSVISETFHRKTYGPGQQTEFTNEVTGASDYVGLIDWEQSGATEPSVPQSVTRSQAKRALLLRGKLALVQPAINAIPDSTQRELMQIEWTDSNDFVRSRTSVIAIGAAIGLDSAALDDIFTFAATL